jgi:molybdopterin-synthase adenylyltransferase
MQASSDRFSRQERLPGFGREGQARLARASVLVVGCGALGSTVAEQLARAGVGQLTLVDRDLVEESNLQRQSLFTEQDALRAAPKAESAKARLAQVNSAVVVRALVDDLRASNALRHAEGADVVVDCLDNFETRAILNDVAVARRLPLVYGGAVGSAGMCALLLPRGTSFGGAVEWSDARSTPCLRCIMPELPRPGETATCETEGVLGPAAAVVASIQAAMVIRLLALGADSVPNELVRIDLATLDFRSSSLADARDGSCACCVGRRFAHLSDEEGAPDFRVLCGRNAVEVRLGDGLVGEEFARIATRLAAAGPLSRSHHGSTLVLRAALAPSVEGGGPRSLSVVSGAGGTIAIVDGTRDPEIARSLVARWIGV